jgi:hypothetical protein
VTCGLFIIDARTAAIALSSCTVSSSGSCGSMAEIPAASCLSVRTCCPERAFQGMSPCFVPCWTTRHTSCFCASLRPLPSVLHRAYCCLSITSTTWLPPGSCLEPLLRFIARSGGPLTCRTYLDRGRPHPLSCWPSCRQPRSSWSPQHSRCPTTCRSRELVRGSAAIHR